VNTPQQSSEQMVARKKEPREKAVNQGKESTISLTVRLTLSELAALSIATVVVTSTGEARFINAADRGLRKVRNAAKEHPHKPNLFNGRP
jgi:hypothetical protein